MSNKKQRQTPEEMGRQAFLDGLDPDSCPFTKGQGNHEHKRMSWFDGYYSARTAQVMERAKARLGLTGERKRS